MELLKLSQGAMFPFIFQTSLWTVNLSPAIFCSLTLWENFQHILDFVILSPYELLFQFAISEDAFW